VWSLSKVLAKKEKERDMGYAKKEMNEQKKAHALKKMKKRKHRHVSK
jgi:hypothetical protein